MALCRCTHVSFGNIFSGYERELQELRQRLKEAVAERGAAWGRKDVGKNEQENAAADYERLLKERDDVINRLNDKVTESEAARRIAEAAAEEAAKQGRLQESREAAPSMSRETVVPAVPPLAVDKLQDPRVATVESSSHSAVSSGLGSSSR